ncbi:MAG: YggT family protein [Ilumatobacteraceae bacterium]
MTSRALDPTVQEYEQRAEDAERSPVPVFLKIGKVIVWLVYALVLLTAILLTLAFFLRLAGANPDSGFVEWVYRSTERAMEPFRGIFPTHDINGSSVLDTSLLFAAVVYFVVALLIDILLRWITQRLRRQERDIAQARAQADLVAQQAAAQQHVADSAAQQAAAREYAAQQAAAQQYAIAQAAAREVVAQQTTQFAQPSQPVRAKPAPPVPTEYVEPPVEPRPGPSAPPPPTAI